jgi:hypothetical protein
LRTALILLTICPINALLITEDINHNPCLGGIIMRKFTTLPLSIDGNPDGPGQEKIVILLGAKNNHPLGILAPTSTLYLTISTKCPSSLNPDPINTTAVSHLRSKSHTNINPTPTQSPQEVEDYPQENEKHGSTAAPTAIVPTLDDDDDIDVVIAG